MNTNFSTMQLSDELKKAVSEIGFDEATSIQYQAIPLVLDGSDVIGLSQTGSGKTAAFGLPAIDMIDETLDRRFVQVLIICPTRELAMQSCEQLKAFSKYKKKINIVSIFGGDSYIRQESCLRSGCQIVIGTPGRVMDHMRRGTLKLDHVKIVVLDEADEMLNMGFLEDIQSILSSVPEERQTLLFSATMSKEILAITSKFQKSPKIIKIEAKQKTVSTIEQYFVAAPRGKKAETLCNLLEFLRPGITIVFCNTKAMVDELVQTLNKMKHPARGLHGDMKQSQRTTVMNEFKHHGFEILVATDVAARGIDVNDVELVVNFDLPQEDEYYIHRIGRTGRAGKSGKSISIIQSAQQLSQIRKIASFANCKIEKMPLPAKKDVVANNLNTLCEKVENQITSGTSQHSQAIDTLLNLGYDTKAIAEALFEMLFSVSGVDESMIEDLKEPDFSERSDNRLPRRSGARHEHPQLDTVRMRLTIGRQDRVTPSNILGAIAGETGLSGKLFGAIRISDRFSTIDIPRKHKDMILKTMKTKRINGKSVQASIEG